MAKRRSGGPASVFFASDAPTCPARNSPARRAARHRGGPGRGHHGQAPGPLYARSGRLLGGICGRCERRQAARGLPLAPADAAHPRLEHEAVHHHRRAVPLRGRGHAPHRGPRHGRARPRGGVPGQPLPARRRRPDLRQPPLHPARLPRRRHRGGPGRSARGGGHRPRDRARVRRRVRLRLAARRPRLRLRRIDVGRAAERPLLQPRALHRERPELPGEPARVRGRPARRCAGGGGGRGAAEARARASPPRTRACSRASSRLRWSG